jgi:hypothetical protein
MNNDPHLLEKSIETLKMIRLDTHDDMDSSKRAELDKVIWDLEKYGAEKTPTQLLDVLGSCIRLIPAIDKVLNMFSEF